MNAVIGLPNIDTSELVFPRNSKLRELVVKLTDLGYVVTSENHIALCLLAAGLSDYSSVRSILYQGDAVIIYAEEEIKLKARAIQLLAKGMKHFVIDDNLRFYARQLAHDLLENEGVLLFVNSRPPNQSVPLVVIPDIAAKRNRHNNSLLRFADHIASVNLFLQDPAAIIRKGSRKLKKLHSNRNQRHLELFVPAKAFSKKEFPTHDFIQALKKGVKVEVERMLTEKEWLLDRLDLEYQTLFRLTSFEPSQLYIDTRLISYVSQDLGHNSHVISHYNTLNYRTDAFNWPLIREVIAEQALIILDRLQKSTLPIDLFMQDRLLPEEARTSLHKSRDGILAIDKSGGRRRVYFREVDVAVARKIHNDLHYIHTPRADLAFGLFYEDESYPFSVVALEKIDRHYKQIALSLFGYDAENCLDFTRLYSRPGGPKNASSVLFRELKLMLRSVMPNIQAGISTHMPSYTHGNSMLAGGFEIPFLLKDNIHSFVPRRVGEHTCYEMLTNRRLGRVNTEDVLTTKLPLLPVVELIAPFNEPRLTPMFNIGTTMLIRKAVA